jgi:ketosteroid isomerase-like protein
MNKQEFTEYTQAFSRCDYDAYSAWYTDDVILELSTAPPIHGRQGIVDFYRAMNRTVRESLTVHQVVADEDGLAADVTMEFRTHADAPDFVVGALKKGEIIRGGVFVFYTLRDGKIARIRVARSRPLEGPMPQ